MKKIKPTPTKDPLDWFWLRDQGVNPGTIRSGQRVTWYKPDGTPLHNLPFDLLHRQLYRERGWTLAPSPSAVIAAERAAQAKAIVLRAKERWATDKARRLEDFQAFAAESLVRDASLRVSHSSVCHAYWVWGKSRRWENHLGKKAVGRELDNLGGVRGRTKNARYWDGIGPREGVGLRVTNKDTQGSIKRGDGSGGIRIVS